MTEQRSMDEMAEAAMFQRGIYSLAEWLRMQASGATDPGDPGDVQRTDAYLRRRLADWRPSTSKLTVRWDAAVRELVEAALEEYPKWS